ncbi:mitogen-activated protein kinase kinase kinase 17-like [Arachis stenosperma]|uniref:mitogen-activated protein kinase kinase kinase 17-like n=1 Tax=Arachis stenosperma TaxID=217475 RepID=UPI0025ABBE70|nr:mitogen-activated protein kinase kinase kinase 17-like [Arachis stenosperma]
MAPEVARGEEQGFPADVWALGGTVLEMITGKPPWHYLYDDDPVMVLYRIGFWDEVPEIPSHISEEGKDFLTKCFKRDPHERQLVEQLLEHEFVNTFNEHIDYEFELHNSNLHTPMSVLEMEQDNIQTASNCCPYRLRSPIINPRGRISGLCIVDTEMFDA